MERSRSRAVGRYYSRAAARPADAPPAGGAKRQTMGGVTLTQNPMSETPGGAGGGAEGGDDSGWDAFAGYPFPTRVKLYWMANPGLRDFVLYVVFVIVFSIGAPITPPPPPPPPPCETVLLPVPSLLRRVRRGGRQVAPTGRAGGARYLSYIRDTI